MIARLKGTLKTVGSGEALLDVNGITYSVMVSSALQDELVSNGMIGDVIEFAIFHYIEGGVAMGHLVPRLVGFLTDGDRAFFQQLITVQGLGVKKALRALSIPIPQVARAIELEDVQTLKGLPEIGAKTAQKIVMELRGKVAAYAADPGGTLPVMEQKATLANEFQQEALEILKQLQYGEAEAIDIITRTSKANPGITSAEELIQEAFRRIRT